ncbi:DNA topoisomerase 3-alpha [Neocloeon triangulifer]|uniref:DNA topoisomerase 3-alpha n=1 Tax=Neocloeon triangulifer TaxID=2078957 RepID=UPI00286F8CF8|nr:DNA topoisomerase 3-alpha [Neocloeon triangulifer]
MVGFPLLTWTSRFLTRNTTCLPSLWCSSRRLESTMRNILHVAEKNDAAKNISAIMSGRNAQRREGISKFNKIYQFNQAFQGQNCNMIFTSVSGHLLGHDFPSTYRGWNSCNPVDLFSAPVIKSCTKDMENIKRTLEREIRACDTLVIWTDCDREGENIGFEIIDVCLAVKPNIRVLRAKFSQITNQAINRALNNLVEPDKRVSDAVEVRSELDLRIGASFTRFQTLRLQKLFPGILSEGLISYGSCQFPTLGFVVERYKSIQDFISENFWKIEVTHEKEGVLARFNWEEGELFDEDVARSLFEACQEINLATVENVESKPKSKWRPAPLDTVELEKLSSKKLRITAAETMRIAEKLYTQGFISYPRTETNIFPKDLALAPLVEMQAQDPQWGDFAQQVLQDGPNPRQGKKSDQAHPPIHPTKYSNSLQGNEKKVYELIVRHFLACVSKDAKGHETKVHITIGEEKFNAKGLMVLEKNYLEVYIYERWSDSEIPIYNVGEQFVPTTLELREGETSAPNLLTEPELITLMEKHGIGTDATHAEHIETIKKRNYAALTNNNFFIPQQLGMALVEGYDSMGFHMSKPYLRAELEADLKKICEGQKNPQDVLRDQIARYKEVFEQAVAQVNKLDSAVEQHLGVRREANAVFDLPAPISSQKFATCPGCGQDLIVKQKRDGDTFYISCSAYPACRNSIWLPSAVRNVQVTDQTCQQCGPSTKMLKFDFKRGEMDVFYPTLECTTCVMGCDRTFLDNLDIRGFSRRGPARPNQNGGGNNPPDDDFGNGPPGPGFGPGGGGNTTLSIFGSRSTTTSTQSGQNQQSNKKKTDSSKNNAWTIGPMGDFGPDIFTDGNSTVTCSCANAPPAAQRTVRKEGPNKGRQFWGCDKPMGQGCGFFKWADDPALNGQQQPMPHAIWAPPQRTQPPPQRTQPPPPLVPPINNDDEDVFCNCNAPAMMRNVRKEGPNKGRQFWSCGGTNRCNFFQWADEDAPPQNFGQPAFGGQNQTNGNFNDYQGNTNTRQNKRGGGGKRKCSICHQEGHTKTRCPNRN